MAKTDLRARPIFYRTKDSIEAHLAEVFAALAISRHLQAATGVSIKNTVANPPAAAHRQDPHRRPDHHRDPDHHPRRTSDPRPAVLTTAPAQGIKPVELRSGDSRIRTPESPLRR